MEYPGADEEGGYASMEEDWNKPLKECEAMERVGFIKKVYGILSFQLIITVCICIIPYTSQNIREWMSSDGLPLLFVSLALYFILGIVLFCCHKVGHMVPWNYIICLLFTLSLSYVVAFVCGYYDPVLVMVAALMTTGLTIALTAYACFTKKDFTILMPFLFCILIVVIMYGIFVGIYGRYVTIIYCSLMIILYSIFLIIDTQLIIGGKRHQLSLDDYLIGASLLYLDIVILFLEILRLLGGK